MGQTQVHMCLGPHSSSLFKFSLKNSQSRNEKCSLPLTHPSLSVSDTLTVFFFFYKKLCTGLFMLNTLCLSDGCFAKTFCHHCYCSFYLWECKSSIFTIFLYVLRPQQKRSPILTTCHNTSIQSPSHLCILGFYLLKHLSTPFQSSAYCFLSVFPSYGPLAKCKKTKAVTIHPSVIFVFMELYIFISINIYYRNSKGLAL